MEKKQENNKIIAEFMTNESFSCDSELCYKFEKHPCSYIKGQATCSIEDLFYHLKWDWLMPVIEKIEAIERTDGNRIITTWVHIMGKGCIIERDKIKGEPDILFCNEEHNPMTKLEATYLAIVEFITYYNAKN